MHGYGATLKDPQPSLKHPTFAVKPKLASPQFINTPEFSAFQSGKCHATFPAYRRTYCVRLLQQRRPVADRQGKVRGMNTYSNPLTDYSPQMEFYGGPAGGHFHRKRGSGVPTDNEEMELATEFMDVARIDYDIALTDSKLMDLPRAAVWRSCCCIGPVFFDTDMSLMKNFRIPRWEGAKLQVGAQAFNLLTLAICGEPVITSGKMRRGFLSCCVFVPSGVSDKRRGPG